VGGALRAGAAFAGLDVVLGAADTLGGGIQESNNWYMRTGLEEDMVGGFVYGVTSRGVSNIVGSSAAMAGIGVAAAVGGGALATIGLPIALGIGGFVLAAKGVQRFAFEKGQFASLITAGGLAEQKVQFGGNYRDTQAAATMRQAAVQEMSGSLLNARQYLGNEAFYLHR
jgi:hypothetical protein